ncbi:zinc-dependent peptidase [Coraliomargarita sp. SDUM461004]|uniref:Zinc-dependent peptidase n=1 Tax=Thalassobacterium sedimentorum TaxID=3041258 RepID=A0ABU1AGD4_9BACT|nr:zinc-dependent peptidase [Coraliomargarita sp. SDUM461004]MDQ8193895.1 zinc-dependent peptidase [Coraliomargarita sp. SDUM461004]
MSILEKLKHYFAGKPSEIIFKDEWIRYLQNNLPLYTFLPQDLRERLHHKISQFVSATFFEGCNGLELDDEMILTVSAQACILVLNHEGRPYPELNTVLLYPTAFTTNSESVGPGGTVIQREVKCLGESWSNGTVILAWDSVQHGAQNIYDGHNVTLHEFAHQLDSRDGDTDGVPLLPSKEAYQTWATVLGEHCSTFINRVQRQQKTLLDPYGATNPAEYFAVATETFFEKSRQLKRKQPGLYHELEAFYRLDPASWF